MAAYRSHAIISTDNSIKCVQSAAYKIIYCYIYFQFYSMCKCMYVYIVYRILCSSLTINNAIGRGFVYCFDPLLQINATDARRPATAIQPSVRPTIPLAHIFRLRNRTPLLSHCLYLSLAHKSRTFRWLVLARPITAPRTRNTFRSCTVSRSTWGPCRHGSTAPCSSPPRRSRSGSCSARRHSSWWRWSVGRWPSRRSCPHRPDRCPTSRSARYRDLCEEGREGLHERSKSGP